MNRSLLSVFILLLFSTLWATYCHAQEKQYKVAAMGFYNLENLFDTIKDPITWDAEFLPDGERKYNTAVYSEKLDHLATVISELGTEMTPDGVAILGVAEIENRSVLEDLVIQPKLKGRNYQIVHHDSPDRRGVDVGLIYNPKYFEVLNSTPLFVPLFADDGDTIFTRDILWVYGMFDGEPVHVFVNHWPSRRGGEAASSPRREKAAAVCRAVVDSLMQVDKNTKVFIMGDLNDDPVNTSVLKILKARGKVEQIRPGDLYNPWYSFYKKGLGTLAWQDAWNLFDQIIISSAVLDKDQKGFFFMRNEVFNKPYLTNTSGQYKGYPYRTYVAGDYIGGYSDHFPVFIYLLKEVH